MTQPISRKMARSFGMTRYFTGVVCSRGHLADRLVSNSKCSECECERQKVHQKAHPELARAKSRRWREGRQNKDVLTCLET